MNRRNKFFLVILPASCATVIMLAWGSCSKIQHYELSRFISPDICGGCHDEIYGQWKNSMHNLSLKDPVYFKVAQYMRGQVTDPDEIKEAESCVKCHTPLGFISGFPKTTSEEKGKIPEPAGEGIQCDYCHSAVKTRQAYNNGLVIEPGEGDAKPGVKRGPLKDSRSDFHGSAYSAFHTESEICGTCHDVRHVVFGTKLETTYEEWASSPYNSKDPAKKIVCQGCHMHQRPGMPATGSTSRPNNPGKTASSGPDRDHIFTHYFIGGNSVVPGKFGDTIKNKMAEERLKNAARLTIDRADAAARTVTIVVANTGAGHKLPTGLTDTRQMWLEVVVKDLRGATLFTTGKAGPDGYLPEGTILYNTVFGNGKGKTVYNVSQAREILKDRRIPPMGSLTETIQLPKLTSGAITVEARLLYRIADQRTVDAVFGKDTFKLPVVEMASAKNKFNMQ